MFVCEMTIVVACFTINCVNPYLVDRFFPTKCRCHTFHPMQACINQSLDNDLIDFILWQNTIIPHSLNVYKFYDFSNEISAAYSIVITKMMINLLARVDECIMWTMKSFRFLAKLQQWMRRERERFLDITVSTAVDIHQTFYNIINCLSQHYIGFTKLALESLDFSFLSFTQLSVCERASVH